MAVANALGAVVNDSPVAIGSCFRAADPIGTATQYLFRIGTSGTSEGTLVSTTEVTRVAGVDANRQPVLVPTRAQGCVAALLAHVELPPSDWRSETAYFVRADFCRVVRR